MTKYTHKLQVFADVASDYDGYIVNGEQFKTLAEADAYIVEKGLTLPDDEREAFEIHEWPDGTWLGIRCREPEPEDAFIDGPVSVRIADDSVSFNAEFLANDEWNGWVLPYFSREELEKVIRHMNKICYGEFHTFCLTTDEYRVTNYSDGSLIEAFKGIDKNGKHVYPIGTGIWSWEVVEAD